MADAGRSRYHDALREEPAEEPTEQDTNGDVAMLEGEAATEVSADGEFGTLAVTDVRVATHDGLDRLVVPFEGDGIAGWDLHDVDEATSQGSGEPIEVDGEAVLSIALANITLPPDCRRASSGSMARSGSCSGSRSRARSPPSGYRATCCGCGQRCTGPGPCGT